MAVANGQGAGLVWESLVKEAWIRVNARGHDGAGQGPAQN